METDRPFPYYSYKPIYAWMNTIIGFRSGPYQFLYFEFHV
jgi:hypothetical protein